MPCGCDSHGSTDLQCDMVSSFFSVTNDRQGAQFSVFLTPSIGPFFRSVVTVVASQRLLVISVINVKQASLM